MRRMQLVLAGIVAAVLAASLLPAHAQEPLDPLMPIPEAAARVQPDLELGSRSVPLTAPLTVADLADLRLRVSAIGDPDRCTYEYLTPGNVVEAVSEAAVPRLRIHLADGNAFELTASTVNGEPGDYKILESCQLDGDSADFGFDGLDHLPGDAVVERIELVEILLAVKYLEPEGADVYHLWDLDLVSDAFERVRVGLPLRDADVEPFSGVGGAWSSQTGKDPKFFRVWGELVFVVDPDLVPAPEAPDPTPAPEAPEAPERAAESARPVPATPTFTG